MPELAETKKTFFTALDFLQPSETEAWCFKLSLQKGYGFHHELLARYGIITMSTDLFTVS